MASNTDFVFIILRETTDLKLVQVLSQPEWEAYHRIRRYVLFDLRGLSGYDDHHPDDRKPEHLPLIFVDGDEIVGALRLDLTWNGNGVVRTVAIVAERQRQGIGRAMMTAVDTLAMAHEAFRLEAHAAPEAVGFYLKIGWELVDAHRPNALMAKLLK
ncbi:GNAT family N-acetyltransferase [Agrobacterium sp. rho-13.3]|uniref:GNAT family N-acetyltransferase n=1 Tax=Agrobacterium sp. rho-13.3 TaxID=3072980 RepID=UPI002A13F330|nr:GNAT family N-acetyltransferase [Agrobacterium sp. rho-13.3]MDX8306215.1 GNAT family N-acetyltransferase [Agrobacterium sp. rho-13.3]MDX8307454.1 GNAT family N-acetyltransferase [Agrobacterium sp. rho-13.3]